MTKRDIAGLCCRLAGILIITSSITMIVMKLFFISDNVSGFLNLYHVGIANQATKMPLMQILTNGATAIAQLILFGLGIWLWVNANRISAWIFPHRNTDLPFVISKDFALSMISLMGVVILAMALPRLFTSLYMHSRLFSGLPSKFPFTAVSAAINSAFGIWLLCGARNIFGRTVKSTFNKGI